MSANSHVIGEGRYELFESIGSGGMATVYRGHDTRLGVDRAIKVLSPSYASKKKVRARFEAEARTMAVLDHPNIVRVYDVGSNDETAWIVMEIIEGPSLLGRIKQEILDVEESLRITAYILEALKAAHSHGIVHRDIKPHNVLLSKDGAVRITDFGIARSCSSNEESFTKTGTVMGTWAFMAPEQRVDAKGVDHTADIYGLGATLFAMATGETPMDLFASDLDPEMLSKVPEALVPLIRKSTRYQRDERYPNAQAMLLAVMESQSRLSEPNSAIRSPKPPEVTKAASFSADTPPDDVYTTDTIPDPTPPNVTYIPEPSGSDESEAEGIDVTKTPPPFRPTTPTSPETQLLPPMQAALKKDRLAMWILLSIVFLVLGQVRRVWNSEDTDSSEPVQEVVPPPPDIQTEVPPTQVEPVTAEDTKRELDTKDDTVSPPSVPQATPPQDKSEATPNPLNEPTTPQITQTPPPSIATDQAPTPNQAQTNTQQEAARIPTIEHLNPTEVQLNSNLAIAAKILNLRPYEIQEYQMTVHYRAAGASQYRTMAMTRDRLTWQISLLVGPDLEDGLEYFIKAKPLDSQDGRLQTLKSATNLDPHRVRVVLP